MFTRFRSVCNFKAPSILLTLLLNGAVSIHAQTNDQICADLGVTPKKLTTVGLKPLLLFTEYSAWSSVVGSDTPTFAAYEDGTVIYWRTEKNVGTYVTTHLSPNGLQQFLTTVGISELASLKSCYSIINVTDAPTNVLTFDTPSGYRTISIYGPIREDNNQLGHIGNLPLNLQAGLKTLLSFSKIDATPWQPPLFEVIIWPFSYAKGEPAVWPANWPGLTDPKTVKRKSSYSLYLPISQLDAFKAFVGHMPATQAILLDGQKWTLSTRFPFPHELPLKATR